MDMTQYINYNINNNNNRVLVVIQWWSMSLVNHEIK